MAAAKITGQNHSAYASSMVIPPVRPINLTGHKREDRHMTTAAFARLGFGVLPAPASARSSGAISGGCFHGVTRLASIARTRGKPVRIDGNRRRTHPISQEEAGLES